MDKIRLDEFFTATFTSYLDDKFNNKLKKI